MAFTGAPVILSIGPNLVRVGGLILGANVGPFDPTGVAPDSGLLTTDQTTPPAGAVLIPPAFGIPAPGAWTQADVDAVSVSLNDAAPIATNMVFVKTLVGGNLQVGVHSRNAAPPIGIEVSLDAEHTIKR